MEAIIRTKDKNIFNSVVQFLKSLQFEVETKSEKKPDGNKPKKNGLDLKSFSFAQSMEATKGIKGSLSEAVIAERRRK